MSVSTNSQPGYITTICFGGTNYHVSAYSEEGNGNKRYLPVNCDQQSFEKIKNLTSGLLNAHEAHRVALKEAAYALKASDSQGLIKLDNTTVSHDFFIEPISSPLANQMANAVSLPDHPLQASAVKAQDVWNALEGIIRGEIGETDGPAPSNGSTTANTAAATAPGVGAATPINTDSAPVNNHADAIPAATIPPAPVNADSAPVNNHADAIPAATIPPAPVNADSAPVNNHAD